MQTRDVARAAVMVALAVALSPFFIPVGVAKCYPAQHMINVMAAAMLGPVPALLVAFMAALARNVLGLGTLLAFPGGMFGALLAGLAYRAFRRPFGRGGGRGPGHGGPGRARLSLAGRADPPRQTHGGGDSDGRLRPELGRRGPRRPGRPEVPAQGEPVAADLELEQVSYAYPGGGRALAELDLDIEAGSYAVVFGPNGSGKSTFAYLPNGLIPHVVGGVLGGRVTVRGRDTRTHRPDSLFHLAGLVFQDPEAQLFSSTVRDELAFGLENMGLAPGVVDGSHPGYGRPTGDRRSARPLAGHALRGRAAPGGHRVGARDGPADRAPGRAVRRPRLAFRAARRRPSCGS